MKPFQSAKEILSQLGVQRIPGVELTNRFLTSYLSPDGPTSISYESRELVVDPKQSGTEYNLYWKGEYEHEVQRCIHDLLQPGDVAIDIGAHVGHHTLSMLEATGGSGSIFAFEPSPERVKRLKRNVSEYDTVTVFETALSSDTGSVRLDTSANSPRVDSSAGSISGVAVDKTTLDQFITSRYIHDVGLVKIDIEGHEVDAIIGCEENLDRVQALILEIHGNMISKRYGENKINQFCTLLSRFEEIRSIDTGKEIEDVSDLIRGGEREHLLLSSFQRNS